LQCFSHEMHDHWKLEVLKQDNLHAKPQIFWIVKNKAQRLVFQRRFCWRNPSNQSHN
jgi:hypothetical protein